MCCEGCANESGKDCWVGVWGLMKPTSISVLCFCGWGKYFCHFLRYFILQKTFFISALTVTTHRTAGKGGDHLLFHSTTSTRSRVFRHLFATLHVRWLSHIFNRTACIYQTATRWGLPPYRITIWLIDVVILIFVCLFDDLILGFCSRDLTWETGGLELTSTITLV